ncbi:MAG TPA: hypothetical protein VKA35_03390 [Solirubrobacterales bacterium]|nr:hypothetical protein [Solirubrobacterales bacterium]
MLLVLALVGALAASALAASGCGDSEEEALTKKQFVRRTQGYCNRGYHKQERAMREYADAHGLLFGGGEPWEQELINNAVVLEYVRMRIEYWKSLPPPEGDEKKVGRIIEAMEEGLETSEKEPEALAEPRPGHKALPEPFAQNRILTRAYGPWLCGQA